MGRLVFGAVLLLVAFIVRTAGAGVKRSGGKAGK